MSQPQLRALVFKSLLVFRRTWWWTLFRSFLLPVAFVVFMGEAKHFFVPFAVYGVAEPRPIPELASVVGDLNVVYYATQGMLTNEMHTIMSAALAQVPPSQIIVAQSEQELMTVCHENLRGVSRCLGAVGWNSVDSEANIYNYTLRANSGLARIRVDDGSSDSDVYVLPLQWAVDSAIANATGHPYAVRPQSMPYTDEDEAFYQQSQNRVYSQTLTNWLAPAIYLGVIGVIYHLAGLVAKERELGLSSLLTAMGVPTWNRLLAFELSFTLVYLPGWIALAVALAEISFHNSNAAVTILYHLVAGPAQVSFALFLATLFKSAQVAGIVSSGIAVLLAIGTTIQIHVSGSHAQASVYVLSFLFPPANYAYFIATVARAQRVSQAINLVKDAPDSNTLLIVIILAAIVQIPAFFGLALYFEKLMHGLQRTPAVDHSQTEAVVIQNLNKTYTTGRWWWQKRATVHAVADLSLAISRGQIVCLLGANGSGKTTTLEMVSGMQSATSGSISLAPDTILGICPQKNVLWDLLTVEEHLKIWAGLKGSATEIDGLIEQCDLLEKRNTRSANLSGGQKRKLQLAIMFMGNASVCCVDEVSSGLDPLSRRKIWDILLARQGQATIILTTHFLDEADLLADEIAIMSKGVLRAEGTAVHLKHRLGGAYRVFVEHEHDGREMIVQSDNAADVLVKIMALEAEGSKYRVAGPELETVFLKVASADHEQEIEMVSTNAGSGKILTTEKGVQVSEPGITLQPIGRPINLWRQTVAMFRKRLVILRRNSMAEIATFAIPIIVAAATRTFLTSFTATSCAPQSLVSGQEFSFVDFGSIDFAAGPVQALQDHSAGLSAYFNAQASYYQGIANATAQNLALLYQRSTTVVPTVDALHSFVETNFSRAYPGGLVLNPPTLSYVVNLEDFGAYTGFSILNAIDNVLMNGTATIAANYSPLQNPWTTTTGDTLQFVVYFGLAMAVAPAFSTLYPTYERISKVRAMHYSNGLRVVPLWTAYTIFNSGLWLVGIGVVTGIIASSNSSLVGVGYLFVVFVLYGLASVLLSFVVSLMVQSELAAFALAAAIEAIWLLLYLIAYLCVLTFDRPQKISDDLLIVHFVMALPIPVASLIRALFVTLNLFGVLCRDNGTEVGYKGSMLAYGGPVLYLVVQSMLLYCVLIWHDSAWQVPRWLRFSRAVDPFGEDRIESSPAEVQDEVAAVRDQPENYKSGLRLVHVSKHYGETVVVDDVTFGVQSGETFALLGPNGAGKTTMFNMLRGETPISNGQVYINGISVADDRNLARSRLGVCPQFDAMDKMTVVEILRFYAGLRGLTDIDRHVEELASSVGITRFRTSLAHKLSGGNKRKLSLAIALIGNPPVLLLDEPSSGMDAYAKRIMWKTLVDVAQGRSIVLTTHSMEEADALADRAGILAKRMLTVGATERLRNMYGRFYHIHLVLKTAPASTKQEVDSVIARIKAALPGSMVGDRIYQGQIKMSVPVHNDTPVKVSDIFSLLEGHKDAWGVDSYSVASTSLEEVFLHIVGANGDEL